MLEQISEWKRLKTGIPESHPRYPAVQMDSYRFFRIHSISLSNELDKEELPRIIYQRVQQFIISCAGHNSPLILRIRSERAARKVSIYIGAGKDSGPSLGDRFAAYFQSVSRKETVVPPAPENFAEQALVTGIPATDEDSRYTFLEPFLRLIQDRDAMLEVVARPINKSSVMQQLKNVTDQRTANSKHLSLSRSESRADSETYSSSHGETITDASNSGGNLIVVNSGSTTSEGRTSTSSDTKGLTETLTTSMEYAEHEAVQLDELLEIHTERLHQALASGLWKTAISVYAQDRAELNAIADVYRSAFSSGTVEPYQLLPLSRPCDTISWLEHDAAYPPLNLCGEQFRAFSFLTGEELACVWAMPKEDVNGYEMIQSPRFGQNPPDVSGIPLGHIYDGDELTSTIFPLDPRQLVKHLLVSGITGSGKTNTIFNLLSGVNVPFLIIEPAKREYRGLKVLFPELRVYTLGNEAVCPLRVNPFYFPLGVNIQQHIDNLKVIFNASFTMYASMPNILEQCITNVYIKKGWSLTLSRNIYQNDPLLYAEYFPTIEDLYHEIDAYTKELGYAQEQMQNIRAALLTRIKSLMTGGKGWMLNTSDTMDVQQLLRYPTIFELEAVADDDEKSLIIGLISVFIYEYLKSEEPVFSGELKHLLVLEEAHRIFANVNQHGSQEDVNIKGKAVESLSHILSEIRAYGEGMIIVDQVPTKLAPDVLKNTNSKIIHRIVSKDDCDYVANSLGIDGEKASFLSKLKNGAALMFSDGMNAPVHMHMLHGKEQWVHVPDSLVRENGKLYNPKAEHSEAMHPITEIIMQNPAGYRELMAIVNAFYRSLIDERLVHLQTNYNIAGDSIIRSAAEHGFDLEIDTGQFVVSFIRETLIHIVKTNPKISKKINKRIFLERYIKACLELTSKDYEVYKKTYLLLELNQQKLGGDCDV